MRLRILLFFLTLLPLAAFATHNRAGEIIVRSQGCDSSGDQLTVCATIITYTETAQTEVDRDSLEINWGDGSSQVIGRTNKFPIAPGIQRNEYTFCHRYPGFSRYVLSFQDVNRVRNVRNIPGSVNIPFSVSTSYTLVNPAIDGCNSSPELTQDPIDNACIGSVWTHNPGAFDVDGDSLAFEFTTPSFAPGAFIPNYVLPNQVGGANSDLRIDPRTGQITWDSPSAPGEYNLAFLIKSFRNGIPLDTVVRDMQIFVDDCANEPPVIDIAREEICVVAGELVEFRVVAGAPQNETEQQVTLTASGRPFDLEDNPATFLPQTNEPQDDPVVKTFRWQTSCEDISDQEYFVILRAVDTGAPRPTGLATLRSVSIKVVAPPPEDLQASVNEDLITLSWQNPYDCQDSEDPSFLGFTVWRREGSNNFAPDTCETGLSGRGYTQISDGEVANIVDGRYVFEDDDVIRGRTYCYRVVAIMVRKTAGGGFIYEEIESIPSKEVCVQLARDIPLLTKVDVTQTSATDGEIDVCWILPQANSLDTIQNPGPYRYVLSRAPGQTTDPAEFETIQSYQVPFFGSTVPTCYSDDNLDTESSAYSYRIELFTGGDDSEPLGEGQPASSVRLSGQPTDRAVDLSWTELVPWTNTSYEVFRRLPGGSDFQLVATVAEPSYLDEGLENGEEYCYYIRSTGSYNVDDIPSPLLNRSQVLCLIAEDNVAPCAPVLSIESVCDREVDCSDDGSLFNLLEWTPPAEVCGDDDVAGYRIYFAADSSAAPELIAQIETTDVLTFRHTPPTGIVGCYFITAVDANDNESEPSNEVCVTNCPVYELPNVFTPNGDNANDLLKPRVFCFVERVELKMFNRWGQLVFQTEDPAINWDGTNLNGEPLPSGTYFYVVQVYERQLSGVVPSEGKLSGYVELITNR